MSVVYSDDGVHCGCAGPLGRSRSLASRFRRGRPAGVDRGFTFTWPPSQTLHLRHNVYNCIDHFPPTAPLVFHLVDRIRTQFLPRLWRSHQTR